MGLGYPVNVSSFKSVLLDTYREMNRDNVFDGAAVLAYYLMLSIFPAMIALLAVTPYLPIAHVDRAILDLMHQALPLGAADAFTGVVQEVTQKQRGGLLTFGVLLAYWSASTGMYAVMRQLNVAFDVRERRSFIRARATALSTKGVRAAAYGAASSALSSDSQP